MNKAQAEGVKAAILAYCGSQYPITYPNGETSEITARLHKIHKDKRPFWSAMIGEVVPVGSIITIDSQQFEITDQRESDTLTRLALIQEAVKHDYSEY